MPAAGARAPVAPPLFAVTLWPHRSLTGRGVAALIGLTAAGLSVPLVALRDTAVVPVLLPFSVAVLLLVWLAIRRNQRDGRLRETVRLWPGLIEVVRREPDGRERRWTADPHWVRVTVADTPRMQGYLTLSGGGRTIELGAFLTAPERAALAQALRAALVRARTGGG